MGGRPGNYLIYALYFRGAFHRGTRKIGSCSRDFQKHKIELTQWYCFLYLKMTTFGHFRRYTVTKLYRNWRAWWPEINFFIYLMSFIRWAPRVPRYTLWLPTGRDSTCQSQAWDWSHVDHSSRLLTFRQDFALWQNVGFASKFHFSRYQI
jgi:hypothetical protein